LIENICFSAVAAGNVVYSINIRGAFAPHRKFFPLSKKFLDTTDI
jgi:hypothetical protein